MIHILLDSASDIRVSGETAHAVIPLTVTVGERNYLDGVDLNKDEFYRILTAGEEFPKTSQPSPEAFLRVFEQVRDRGDQLIYLALSSALSGTYQSASIAKEMADYDGIHLVDTKTVSYGIAILAHNARRMVDEGAGVEEILAATEELKGRIRIFAVVDTLEYLHRGGRLSRGAAAIGSVAGLRPTITVSDEGTVAVVGKSLGRCKAMQHILKTMEGIERDENYPVDTLFSYGEENCTVLEEKLTAAGYPLGSRLQIGSAIGAHVGPGACGVLFVVK